MVTSLAMAWTSDQKEFKAGPDHQIFNMDPTSPPHLQHVLGTVAKILWRIGGVLYQRDFSLNPFSGTATFLDPAPVMTFIDSQSLSVSVTSISLFQALHALPDLGHTI